MGATSPADSGSGGLIREPTGPHKLLPLWEHPFADMFAAGDGHRKRALLLAFVRAGIGAGEPAREACRDAVKKLAQVSSPFIFRILEARRIQDGRLVLAGDLLEGTTVGQHLLDGPLAPARTIAVLRQLCHALDTAHGLGILHGALSVASVILGTVRERDDAVSLTDFGLAGVITAAAMGDHEVEIQPLSPEKIAGEGPSVREDIYLLGAIAYAMLAGRPLFAGTPADVRKAHAEATPAALDVPEALRAIVDRCLAKAPADRYASAREVEDALVAAQAELGLTTAWDDLPRRADPSAGGVPAELARDHSQPNPIAPKIPSGPYSVIGAPPEPVVKPEPTVRRIPPAPALRPAPFVAPKPVAPAPAPKPVAPAPAPKPVAKVALPPPPATPRATGHKWAPLPKVGDASRPTAETRTERRATALGIDLSRPIRTSEGRMPLPPDAAGVRRTAPKIEPKKTEAEPSESSTKPEPDKHEPDELEPKKVEPDKAETKKPEPDKAETKPETKKPEPDKAEPDKAETKTPEPEEAVAVAEPPRDTPEAEAKSAKAAAAEAPTVVRPARRPRERDDRKAVPAWMLAGGAALVIGLPLLFMALGKDDPPAPPSEVASRENSPGKRDASAPPARAPDPPAARDGDAAPAPAPTPPPAEPTPAPAPSDDAGEGDDAPDLVLDEADPGEADPTPAPKPKPTTSPRERAAQLVASGKSAHASGNVARAENLYKLALSADPRSHSAAAALGQIYFNKSQWPKSATYYGKAVAAAPGSSDYRLRLGDAHFKNGKYAEARKHYAKAKTMGNKAAAGRLAKVDAKLGK